MAFMRTEFAIRTDVGRSREHNEDYVAYYEPAGPHVLADYGRLYLVADGVGGASAGEVASEYAARKIIYEYFQSDDPDPAQRLSAAFKAANAGLFGYLEQHPDQGRMSTTVVAALLLGDQLHIANIGDSRAYLLRDGRLQQVTQDHSLVAHLVAEGAISVSEAESHPRRNVLLRGLGSAESEDPDLFQHAIRPGDRLLLCSDGLTRHVADPEIEMIALRNSVDKATRVLLYLANLRGGRDNISMLLLAALDWMPEVPHSPSSGAVPQDPDIAALLYAPDDQASASP